MKTTFRRITRWSLFFPPILAALCSTSLFAQQSESLPREMTAEEQTRVHEIGKNFRVNAPPEGRVRNVAEFDPMEAVLIRYPLGISNQIVAEMTKDDFVWVITTEANRNAATASFTANNVDLSHVRFIIAPTNSYWTRDYGPWFIQIGDTATAVVDFPYNRPRGDDDAIPLVIADSMKLRAFGMNLVHTGGNYMTTGTHIASSTQIVLTENPSLTTMQVNNLLREYAGIETYHVVQDPNGTYINHIDCWGKFLAPDKVLIRSVPPTHQQFNAIEAAASYFMKAKTANGEPFQVYRVSTPNDQPYTNSFILNRKVFVPVSGQTSTDSAAINIYQQAMPGYNVLGFTGSWVSTDALHCRAIGLADRGMLFIDHTPVAPVQQAAMPVVIEARVVPYSTRGVIEDSVRLYYRLGRGVYQSVKMNSLGDRKFSATIPPMAANEVVTYFIHAVDSSGRVADHPLMGIADPHAYRTETRTSITDRSPQIASPSISACYPNPFSNLVYIDFRLPHRTDASIQIHDVSGRLVRAIKNQELGVGSYSVVWDGMDDRGISVPSGIYFVSLRAGISMQVKRIQLARE